MTAAIAHTLGVDVVGRFSSLANKLYMKRDQVDRVRDQVDRV